MMSDMEKKDDNWIPQSHPIPAHWVYIELETAFENLSVTGKKLAQKDYDTAGKIPVIDQGASEIGGYSNNQKKVVTLERPVIIFGDHTKCLKYIAYPFIPGADGIKVLLPNLGIDPKFAFYACKSLQLPDRGYSRHFSFLKKCDFPLAPFNEQKRIVAKIEELFSELDNGIASLKTAREQLKVYHQAVLKYAFEGKLTAKWREENADKLESPEQLLARIQQEREARYQQQLEEWKIALKEWEVNVKVGIKPKKPRPLDLSISDESIPDFQLPYGWIWCKVSDLISELTDYHANGSYEVLKENVELKDEPDYALMIRATNFEKNNFESDQKYIDKSAYEFLSKSKLFGGEILVGKIGNAGKVYFMPDLSRPASLAMNLFCLRFEGLSSTFIYNQLLSARAADQIRSYVKGVGNPTIDKKALRSIDIALPAEAEQEYLVEKIQNALSQIERVESEIQTNLDKSETLRQSILKKAFSGQLVPQDPSDEPASELLARIQAAKEAVSTQKAQKTKKIHSTDRH